jgi:hypothetical protein
VPNLGDMLREQQAKIAAETPGTPAPGTPPATPAAQATPPVTPPATPAPTEADARYAALEQRFEEQARQTAEATRYAQQLTEYVRSLQNPQQPAAPQIPATPAQAKSPTGVTPFDHRLMAFIKQGTDGTLTLEAGAPPDTLIRYAEYQDSVKNFYRDFAQKGIGMFDEQIAERAAAIAKQTIDEYVQVRQAEQIGQQIQQQNEAWMYEKNPDGSRKRTMTGAPALTPEGEKYMSITEYLKNSGTAPAEIPKLAQALMEGDVLRRLHDRNQAGQPAPAAPAAAAPAPAAPAAPPVDPKATFLQQAAQGAAAPLQPVATPAPARGPLRLHDFVKQHAPAFGVTLN